MLGIDRQHEPVEKTAAVAGGSAEQCVEIRRQPDDAQIFGESRWRRDACAVDPADPHRPTVRRTLEAGSETMIAERGVERDGNRKRTGSRLARHVGEFRPTQPPARHEQRQRFEQIGLARPVLPDERHERTRDREIQFRIGAEILKDQAIDESRSLRRHGHDRPPVSMSGPERSSAAWAARLRTPVHNRRRTDIEVYE